MSPLIQVSVSPPCVVVGARRFHAQWVDFYALLALQQREAPATFVTVERVHRLPGWQMKKPGSVGKEIARHLGAIQRDHAAELVCSPPHGKTRAWRLCVEPDAVELRPSPAAIAAWVEGRTHDEGAQPGWGDELLRLVRATALLRKGLASDAEAALGPAPDGLRDAALTAWRALLRGRAIYVDDDDARLDELDALVAAWSQSVEPAGRAVEVRLRSFRVMRDRFADAELTRATLTKMVTDVELTGDAGSLGVLLNVLGVLERRAGNPRRAFEHLARAAGLLGISGDYQTLQATLYNAAQAHRSALKRQGQPPDALAFSLLDLCLLVCHEFRVGEDSALAEITRADWLLDVGEVDAAAALLEQAGPILESTEASYDQAYFLQVRARLRFERGAPMRDVVRDMNAAARIYGEVGDTRAERRAGESLQRLLRVRKP